MKTIKDIKQMMREPASKEWFAKHGMPSSKHKALESAKGETKWRTVPAKRSSPEEQERKMKMFASQAHAHHEMTNKDKIDYQHKIGRAYSE